MRYAHARTFVQCFVVPALCCLLLLSACGEVKTPLSPTPTPHCTGFCSMPPEHVGGTLLYSDWQFPDSTNPWFATTPVDTELVDPLWDRPFVVTPDGYFLPDELTEIPTLQNGDVSSDGLRVTLKLNPNLKWSDGQPLTSSDFIYWINVLLDPATRAASTAGFDPSILVSYTAPDAHTLLLTYKQVFSSFLFYLPFAAPRHAWGSIADANLRTTPEVNLTPIVTSGPFVVGDYASGQSFTLTPNKYYTSTTLHPTILDKLIFKGYQSKDALIAGYQAGETDHAEGFTLADLPKLQGLAGLNVTNSLSYTQVTLNLGHPALQALPVRKAIEEAIDRCAIIQKLFSMSCNTLRVETVEPPPHPDADPTIKEYAFNLQHARADMQAAGWNCSNGTCLSNGSAFPTLTLVTSDDPTLQAAAEMIAQQLAALGINAQTESYPSEMLLGDYTSGGILARGAFDLALFPYQFGLDSYQNLYPLFQSSQIPGSQVPEGRNYGQVNDPMVDQLLATGNTTIDALARKNIYQKLQKYLIQQVYLIPLYLLPNITLNSSYLAVYFPNSSGAGNEWNIGEWYVAQPAE